MRMRDRSSARLLTKVTLSAALFLIAGCSDDDGAPDQGGIVDQGVVTDLGTTFQDQGVAHKDKGADKSVSKQDQGGVQDQGQPKDVYYPDTSVLSNSGAICNASTPCTLPGEECLYFGSTNGMCLGECQKNWDPCPVKDKNTQLSMCSVKSLDGTKWYCGWLCEWSGQTYKCPDDTNFKCVPSAKGSFCQPK